ncbi:MAG: helix-turn-helix transcriptional regulator [Ktedonobacterales bacterium]|nr:helix-turn-helix transcriptional regulator [Ktedonobacterales bacterium]
MIVTKSQLKAHEGGGPVTLRQLRESRLLSQNDLAVAVGVLQTTVSNWERGEQRPQFAQLRKLAEFFKLNPQELQQVIEETMAKKS